MRQITLKRLESAVKRNMFSLDNPGGRIMARMSNGNAWRARRNGATKTWKTRPGEFRIPVKAGFLACGSITHDNFASNFLVEENFAPAVRS